MYLYLYDSFLNNKKYASLLARIETRLTDLGIGGKICRLSPLRNIKELVAEELGNGVKTIVVVGNDKTLSEAINILAKYDVTLGLIPLGPNNTIAANLGLPLGEAACNVIAARMIKKIDLGKINNTYFLSGIKIAGRQVTLECEEQFKVTTQTPAAEITVCNLRPALADGPSRYFNPQDGWLEVFIQPLASGLRQFFQKAHRQQSIIPFKKLAINSRQAASVTTDGQKVLKMPVKIEIAAKKLKIIVGKNRSF